MSEKHLSRVQNIAGKISNLPTRGFSWLSGGALIAIMLLVTIDVITRAIINMPIVGSYELSQLIMVFVAIFAFAYTQVHRSHIAIPVLAERLPKRVQAVLESSAWILGCVLFALVAWQCVIHGIKLWEAGQKTLALDIPVAPFYFAIVAGCVLFSMVLMANFIESLPKVKQ